MNYEINKFSVSQALHAPDQASNIVPIESAQATETGTNPTSSPKPPITTITTTPEPSPKSRALATPAIAGITIAVVVLALLIGGFILLRLRKAKGLPQEPAGGPPHPHHAEELDGSERPHPQKSVPGVMVEEKDQARIHQSELHLLEQSDSASHRARAELPELPPNENSHPFELASSELGLRSNVSTPEPVARSDFSTPEPEWQGSPDLGDVNVGEPSPPLDGGPSPVSSPGSLWSGHQRREPPIRKDSSGSETGWQRTGSNGHSRRSKRHTRKISAGSESSSRPERKPLGSSQSSHVRVDSSESEGGVIRGKFASRPPHQRLDSNDSVMSIQTRLAMNSPGSFFPPGSGHDRQDRPLPNFSSVGTEALPLHRPSPSLESIRSGLLSPAPLEFNEVDMHRFSTAEQRSSDRPPPKEADRS